MNVVHVSSIVGGTAYAPRSTGPLALSPEKWNDKNVHSFLVDGTEGEDTLRSDGELAGRSESPTKTDASASPRRPRSEGPAPVDLWDSNWPTGRYYWTVVPVTRHLKSTRRTSASEPGKEAEQRGYTRMRAASGRLPGGRRRRVREEERRPAGLGERYVPFATGLSPDGRLLSASGQRALLLRRRPGRVDSRNGRGRRTTSSGAARRTRGEGRPARRPSRRRRCFRSRPAHGGIGCAGSTRTLPGNQKMSWTNPVKLQIANADLQGRQGLVTVASAPGIRGRLRSRRAVDRDDRDGRRDHGSRRRPQLRHGDAAAGRRRFHGGGGRRQTDGGLPRLPTVRSTSTLTIPTSGAYTWIPRSAVHSQSRQRAAARDDLLTYDRRDVKTPSRRSPAPTAVPTTSTPTSLPRPRRVPRRSR